VERGTRRAERQLHAWRTPWAFALFIWVSAWAFRAEAQGTLEGASPTQSAAALPVVHEELRIEIDEQAARIVLEQHFENTSSERLEGRYLFRTPEGARVSGLSYWNGEQEIVGEVFEREVAQEVYEEVTGIGRDPALFEQVGEGTFSFRIFPLEPGEIKRVRVRVDLWLPAHGDSVELRLPVSGPNTQVRVDARDPRGLSGLSSPTHELKVLAQDAKHVQAQAQRALGAPTQLMLRYRVGAAPLTLGAAFHRDAGHDGYVLLHLATPPLAAREDVMPKDVTIVIDHSGSMSGEPLLHACAAASQVVNSLDARDRLNLVVFDDRAESMYSEPRELSGEVRGQVLARIQHLASAGGTDIAGALKATLAAQNHDAHPNVVLFMTDGQSDAQAALEVAHADTSDTRIFTIGLGAGVEKPLLSRLAADKRGRFVFIADTASIEPEVARLYAQISAPLLTDVELETEGAHVMDMYPRTLRDLFVDDELRVLARVMPAQDGTISLKARVRAKLRGKDVSYETNLQGVRTVERRWVGMAWAQARVDDLLEEMALAGESDELKNEAIDLALAYNFVTPYTAFLAIPASELTDEAKDLIDSARAAKRKIRESHPDAAALSRSDMPPGDPIIAVRAPADAREVLARFPFGLTLDLVWDELSERWMSRFLVPKDVADGVYDVDVWIVRKDGTLEHAQVAYEIDSSTSAAMLDLMPVAGGIIVRVLSDDEAREVRATLVEPNAPRALLDAADNTGCAAGFLPAEPGLHKVRVVVTDSARNERVLEADTLVTDAASALSELELSVCH
jgi:Ca-activated chloride channel family protein